MTLQVHPRGSRCPECKGKGKVPLLVSMADCRACEGTGALPKEVPSKEEPRCSEGSPPRDLCDEEGDPSYFDDGLEFDDEYLYDYGGGDVDWGWDD